MKIGFIGAGVMGKSMILNLGKKGFTVGVYARNAQKIEDLKKAGYFIYSSIEELVRNSKVIITILGYPQDVEDVYYNHILTTDIHDKFLIDMTTSSPSLAAELYDYAKNKNAKALDCPVTGGDIGARNGTLTIFVGGDKPAYDEILPILEAMGSNIAYIGEAGMGQHAKLANQIGIAGAISAMAEMIAYAASANLDLEKLVEIWSSGSAGSWQLKNMAPRALKGDLEPGFFIKHFIKDMNLALDEAKSRNLDLKMLDTVLQMFTKLAALGYQDKGTQAIIDYYKLRD